MKNNNYTEEALTPSIEPNLIIDNNIRGFLTETIKWCKLMAIVGFVMSALIALLGLTLLFSSSMLSSFIPGEMSDEMGIGSGMFMLMGGFLGSLYIALALLSYFPAMYLYGFFKNTKKALLSNDQATLVTAFSKIKSYFKFCGIVLVICLIIYAIAIIVGFAVAGFALFIN